MHWCSVIVEVKCPFWAKDKTIQDSCESSHAFCLETVGDQRQLKADHPNYWQCQVQMFCTERCYCDFILWTRISTLKGFCSTRHFLKRPLPLQRSFMSSVFFQSFLASGFHVNMPPCLYELLFVL